MSGEAGEEAMEARDSLLLYRLCCDVGFSREQWQHRIRLSDSLNTLSTINMLRSEPELPIYCGSAAEGVAADFLGSDVDCLLLLPRATVIDRGPVPGRETDNIFQFVPTGHAAYVRLQLVAIGDTNDKWVRSVLEYCETDESGKTVYNGQRFLEDHQVSSLNPCDSRSGPALTRKVGDTREIDIVTSIHCKQWPAVQEEWIHRQRPYNWPSPATIQEIVDGGCEVVAVGYPSSPAPHLEWRLSTSSAETRHVRSFNIYQIQCYFLLKLVLVFLIKPLVPHTLCSYHMKTIMLHMVETTDPVQWTRRNLTLCFMKCISMLLRFLEHGNCPQYFIPQHNLFDPKVRGESQRKLVRIVKDLITEGWRCVLRCAPFSNVSTWCQHVEPRCPCFIKHWHEVKSAELLSSWLDFASSFFFQALTYLQEQSNLSCLQRVSILLADNRAISGCDTVHLPCRATVTKLQLYTSGVIGYSLLEAAQCRNSKNPRLLGPIMQCVRQFLEESCDVDVSYCRLKLATFYYQIRQKQQCIKVVRKMLGQFVGETLPVCLDSLKIGRNIDEEFVRRLSSILLLGGDVITMFRHMAFPVSFLPWEIPLAPSAVGELYPARPRVTDRDKELHSVLFIDPLVYACYLLVICYHDLGDPVKSRQTLELLTRTVLNHRQHYLFYPEVARLLLDYCVQYTADRR